MTDRTGSLEATTTAGEAPAARPAAARRLRRKLRRLRNELRAQVAERRRDPRPATWPVHVNLNHTMACNLRYVMCEQGLGKVPQTVMDLEVYRRVRDQLFEHVSEVSLTVMGDPFCVPRPFLREILEDVARYDLRLEVTTNALLMDELHELERLVGVLSKLVLSIDGATPATFERIRPPARWDRLVANVERFLELRRRLPAWRRPLVYFNYVVMRSNLEELPDLVDLAAGWDGYSVTASILIPVEEAIAHEAPDPDDPRLRAVLSEARRRAVGHGMGFRVSGSRPELDADRSALRPGPRARARQAWMALRPVFPLGLNYLVERVGRRLGRAPRECPYLWSKAYVQVDGQVGTCCHPAFYLTGDLRRQDFERIWNGSRYRGLRASLDGPHPAASCRDCHLLRP